LAEFSLELAFFDALALVSFLAAAGNAEENLDKLPRPDLEWNNSDSLLLRESSELPKLCFFDEERAISVRIVRRIRSVLVGGNVRVLENRRLREEGDVGA